MSQPASWFHVHQDTIGRSSGRTATGIVAYVTGQRMKDDETGKWLKRNHPGDVLAFGTVGPQGAPDYLTDNAQLARAWNDAQQADSRKNAQLARHWNIALSRDLTRDEQAAVMQAIAEQFTERYGTLTTWAVHSPTGHGDARNAHGHIVHNMRMVTPEGFGPKVLAPVVFKTAKREMNWARGMIAATINAGLEKAGLDERVTHLSYDARDIDREATRHLGDKQNQAELKGEATPVGDHNRAVAARNAQRDADQAASLASQAQLSAEIIDLDSERRRRKQGMDPIEATEDGARRQAERQDEAYRQAAQAHEKQHGTRQLIEDATRQAEEARGRQEREAEEKKHGARGAGSDGEPADARARYAEALGAHYDIRDPFGSLAKAAMTEYALFGKQQAQLKSDAAQEADPAKKQAIELRRQIEAHDYMAITHERLASIGRAIAGRDSQAAQQDDVAASRHRARGMELRAERDGGLSAGPADNKQPQQRPEQRPEQQRSEQQRPAEHQPEQQRPAAQRPDKPHGAQTDWDAQTGRWNVDATQMAPIRNVQHTGNAGHQGTRAEQIAEARQAYLASMGKEPAADRQQESKTQERAIVARQAEETKQREGLKTDQPAETARAPTKEGRDIVSKEEARAAYRASMRGDSVEITRGQGQEAAPPGRSGGEKGR